MDDDVLGTIAGWIFLGGILFLIVGWNDDGWVGTARYAVAYKVPLDQVHSSRKPYDCDWGTAPIGSKHCTYKAEVTAYNASGQAVGADTMYVRNKETGELFVSYNNGPLVRLPPAEIPDPKVRSVEVRWVKTLD